jgi:chemotaxis protein histidine kinase CheA
MKEAETEAEAKTKAENDYKDLERRINEEMNQLLAEMPHEDLAHQNEMNAGAAEIRAREINDAIKASIKEELEEKNTELKKELKEDADKKSMLRSLSTLNIDAANFKAKAKAQPKLNTPTTTFTEILADSMMTKALAEIPTETEANTKTEPKNDDKTEAKTRQHRPFRGVSGDKPWWLQAAPKAPKPAATPKITPPEPTAVAPPPAAPRPVSLVRQGHGNRCSSCNAWCPLDKPAPQGYLPAPPAPPPSKLPEPRADRLDKSLKNIEDELKWLRNKHGHITNLLNLQAAQIDRQDEQLKEQSAQMKEIIRLLI